MAKKDYTNTKLAITAAVAGVTMLTGAWLAQPLANSTANLSAADTSDVQVATVSTGAATTTSSSSTTSPATTATATTAAKTATATATATTAATTTTKSTTSTTSKTTKAS